MFLMHKPTGTLVEILTLDKLFNPCQTEVMGISHAGEELQEPSDFLKLEMVFPSGESLPLCWIDSQYRGKIHHVSWQEPSLIAR
ncbi:MAG: acetyltransferase [Nostocaceae cyanobacterium]|nr:acetyltransferase [Nostocaceae cyanobacterium]